MLAAAGLIGTVLVGLYTTVRIWQVGEQDDRRPADAIVVLGAAQYDGRPSPVFEARLAHAVELFEAGYAPWLVVTGGGAEGDRTTEAAAARAFAIAHGVPEAAILAEDRSRNTLQSLEAVGSMLRERGLTTVLVVSDRTHTLRVLRLSLDQGLDAHASPATNSPTDADIGSRAGATIHELGALAFYFVGAGSFGGPESSGATGTP
jgi:uncharacterized SAM-binding protein YcdF (DUF218 family)